MNIEVQPAVNQIGVGQVVQSQSVETQTLPDQVGQVVESQRAQTLPDAQNSWIGNSVSLFNNEEPNLEQKLKMYKKWKQQKQLTIWFEERYQDEQNALQLNNLNFFGRINFKIQKCFERTYANWCGFVLITLFLALIFWLISENKKIGKE